MTAPDPQRLRWRVGEWAFFALLVALSTRLLASAVKRGVLLTEESPLLYHAATLAFNYFDFGFVRRGLGGSAVSLLGPDRLLGTAIFHMLCAAAVAAGAATLLARLRLPAGERLPYVVLLAALMLRWGEDPGRTDLAVAALLVAAGLAFQRGRLLLACACIGVSLGVHESGLVFGLSLLAGLLLDAGRWRQLTRRVRVAGFLVLGTSIAAYLLTATLPHADVPTLVSAVRSQFPPHESVDWAIYFAVSGSRGVQTSICQNLGDPTYPLHLMTGLGVLGLYMGLLRRQGRPGLPAALLVAVPPFLLLSAVANDLARWAVLAAFNVWVLSAVAAARAGTPVAEGGAAGARISRSAAIRLALALLVVPLIHSKTGRIEDPIYSPSPAIDRAVQAIGGPRTPRFVAALARCDPDWRSALGEHGGAPRPAVQPAETVPPQERPKE